MANFFDRINPLKNMFQFGDYCDGEETSQQAKEVHPIIEKVVPKKKDKSKAIARVKAAPFENPKSKQLVMGSKIASEFPMPFRQPRKSNHDFERLIGDYTYRIVASKKYGYPSGQDPLLLLFIEDRARLTKSPKVFLDSIREMLVGTGLDDGGYQYERTRIAVKRFFNCQFLVFRGKDDSSGVHIEWFKAIHLKGITPEWKEEDGNYVILSDDHFKRVMDTPIPYEMEIFCLLSHSAGACALYRLIAPKAYRAIKNGPIYIGLDDFIEEMGCEEYSEKWKAKQMLHRWKKECDAALKSLGLGELPIHIGRRSDHRITIFPKVLVRGVEKSIAFNVQQAGASKSKKKSKSKYDVDWALEKEIQDFNSGITDSISQAASKYMAEKADTNF